MKILPFLLSAVVIFSGNQLFSQLPLQVNKNLQKQTAADKTTIVPGAERLETYLPLLKGKSVAVFANQTSMVNNSHLVDTLIKCGIKVIKIFGPEHGFRGDADAGEQVGDMKDKKTGLPVISLYGKHKKPTPHDSTTTATQNTMSNT